MSFVALSFLDAWCELITKPGPGPSVPEFDGPAGIAAAALLISVAAVLYDKVKK